MTNTSPSNRSPHSAVVVQKTPASQKTPVGRKPSVQFSTAKRRWVLLRGLGREQRHWGAFLTALTVAFPEDVFIPLDLPGLGVNRQQPAPLSIHEIVDHLRHECADLLAQGPIHLLAISLGGMVAADWMARYPDDIQRAVLINSSSRLNPMPQRIHPRALWQLLSSAVVARCTHNPVRFEKKVAHWVVNTSAKRDALAQQWASYYPLKKISLRAIFCQLSAAAAFNPAPVIQPLLVLNSTGDRMVNAKCSETLANFWRQNNPHVVLHTHSSAGHDLPVDDTPWIIEKISAWVNRSA